jgi:aspartyl-tRNA(Asn)/glutamyl-tRNA(Gln) amidotransferase subunit A
VAVLKKLGCEIQDISLPATDYAIATYYVIATAEASSNLARYDGVRYTSRSAHAETLTDMYRNTRGEGFGAECKRRIMLGTYVLSAGYYDAYYLKAQKVRAHRAGFPAGFRGSRRHCCPVSPFSGIQNRREGGRSLEMYLSDIYDHGIAGRHPCMSVPCGRAADGLPVGMQILTGHFDEAGMFRLADAFRKSRQGCRIALNCTGKHERSRKGRSE